MGPVGPMGIPVFRSSLTKFRKASCSAADVAILPKQKPDLIRSKIQRVMTFRSLYGSGELIER
jgi:hypothetical protein